MTSREEDLLHVLRALRDALEATDIDRGHLHIIDLQIAKLQRHYGNDRR